MPGAGVFGKIPAQGDFVRLNASTPAALAFDAFLQESLDGLRRTGGDLVPEPVRFAFFDAGGGTGVCGVFAPSRDSVGRSYPLSVFAPLASARDVAALPIVTRQFVEAAGELLAEAESLGAPAIASRVRELPGLSEEGAGAETLRRMLDGTGAEWLWKTMFPDEPLSSAAYAIHTAKLACDSAGARASAGTGVILDCPTPNEPAALFWLATVEALLGGRGGGGAAAAGGGADSGGDGGASGGAAAVGASSGPTGVRTAVAPSFFWSASHGGRMLIALGRPPSSLLTYLTRPEASSTRLWPLATQIPAARQSALRDIAPDLLQALASPDSSLLDVVEALRPAP
jgi:type VI secretion system protein ImpM